MNKEKFESLQPLTDRLGRLTQDQLQQALDRFDLGELLDVERVRAGLSGQNFFFTADSGEWVFRGAPRGHWQYRRERHFADLLRRNTEAPVPWPYHVETSEYLFGWPYALMPRLPGASPYDLREKLDLDEFCDVACVMADGLAAFHQLKAETWEPFDLYHGKMLNGSPTWGDWMVRTLDAWRERVLDDPRTVDDEDLEVISVIEQEAAEALLEPFEACLVHHDYKEGNLLVLRENEVWRVSGIIDLEGCAFGDGEQDLPTMLARLMSFDQSVARAFLERYVAHVPLRPGYVERQRIYMLIDHLILWNHGRRHGIWFPAGMRFRDYLNRDLMALGLLLENM